MRTRRVAWSVTVYDQGRGLAKGGIYSAVRSHTAVMRALRNFGSLHDSYTVVVDKVSGPADAPEGR